MKSYVAWNSVYACENRPLKAYANGVEWKRKTGGSIENAAGMILALKSGSFAPQIHGTISKQNQRFIFGIGRHTDIITWCLHNFYWLHPPAPHGHTTLVRNVEALKAKTKILFTLWHFMTSFYSVHVGFYVLTDS